jgi:hypothetical protein
MKKLFFLFVIAFGLASCNKETFEPDDVKNVNGLNIRCLSFEDSRCPEDVVCVTAGTAFATLWIDSNSWNGTILIHRARNI